MDQLRLTKEEFVRRMEALPEDAQQEAIELLVQIYASQGTAAKGEETKLCAGTQYEIIVPLQLLPTLEEWMKGIEAQQQDPSLGQGDGMPEWESRVPRRILEAYKRQVTDRVRKVEETMAMASATQNILG